MGLKNLENLKFVDANPEEMEIHILDIVEGLLERKLARADPLRLFLLGVEALLIQQRLLFDQMAKMNLLACARGGYLDHIGALVGTERLPAAPATATMKLTLSAVREQAVIIPKGARITAGDNIYFALNENAIIPMGELSVLTTATCTENGERGNGYLPGEISRIVDPVPFWAAAENTTKSEGGADVEDDEAYRERIHEAPEKFSTAGPTLAYEYHAKAASALIADLYPDSPAPGEVVIYPLLKGGIIPGEEILSIVREKLDDRSIRPLTDKVSVKAPESVKYDVDAVYYIDRSDATEATAIQIQAGLAVQEFIAWQKEKLGRDINPTELYYRLRAAGVKRVEIKSPAFTKTEKNQVAIADHVKVTFGGLEDE